MNATRQLEQLELGGHDQCPIEPSEASEAVTLQPITVEYSIAILP